MLFLLAGEGGGSILDKLGIHWPVILVQAVIFIATLAILHRFLFKPVQEFSERRDKEIEEAFSQIEKNRSEVERLAEEYRAKIEEIEKKAYERLQSAIKEGLDAKAKIIAEAEQVARKEVDAAKAAIRKEKAAAREALRAEVKRLALDAASRLTGRKLDSKEHEKIVDEIISRETR